MMTKLIGWLFVLMCPFVGGSFLLCLALNNLYGWSIGTTFGVATVVWVFLYAAWFEDSKYQLTL